MSHLYHIKLDPRQQNHPHEHLVFVGVIDVLTMPLRQRLRRRW